MKKSGESWRSMTKPEKGLQISTKARRSLKKPEEIWKGPEKSQMVWISFKKAWEGLKSTEKPEETWKQNNTQRSLIEKPDEARKHNTWRSIIKKLDEACKRTPEETWQSLQKSEMAQKGVPKKPEKVWTSSNKFWRNPEKLKNAKKPKIYLKTLKKHEQNCLERHRLPVWGLRKVPLQVFPASFNYLPAFFADRMFDRTAKRRVSKRQADRWPSRAQTSIEKNVETMTAAGHARHGVGRKRESGYLFPITSDQCTHPSVTSDTELQINSLANRQLHWQAMGQTE